MKHHIPRYTCSRAWMDNGPHCIGFGGLRVDDAIEEALLGVVGPGAIAAAVAAAKEAGERRDQVRDALSRDLEAARYAADRAFRQYDAADPANRLVASELEARWNRSGTVGRPPTRSRLPAPVRSESGAVPTDNGVRLHNRQRIASVRKQSIQTNEYQSVDGAEGEFLWSSPPQNIYLLPQRPNLCLKRCSRADQIDDHQ
jgi:hypothetical protein